MGMQTMTTTPAQIGKHAGKTKAKKCAPKKKAKRRPGLAMSRY